MLICGEWIALRHKLPQHPQIILKQQPDIINLIIKEQAVL